MPQASSLSPIVVGIDLGTTRSLVSISHIGRHPSILPLGRGKAALPSVLFFQTADSWLWGDEADDGCRLEPGQGAWLFKRRMGDPSWALEIHDRRFSACHLSACLLRSLREEVERRIPNPILGAVLTIPAYALEAARRDALEAARNAGWTLLALFNEPTAAALAYHAQRRFSPSSPAPTKETALVYDLGGGTLDITVMEIEGSDLRVLASVGDPALGGADWDDAFAWRIAAAFRQRFGWDPLDEPLAFEALRRSCQTTRERLSTLEETTLSLEIDGCRFETAVTRDFLEASCLDLLQRSESLIQRALETASRSASEIQTVLLAGGGSRMPMIQRGLQTLLGRAPDRSLDPESAVALGAAWRALEIAPLPERRWLSDDLRYLPGHRLQEISPHPLGFLILRQGQPINRLIFPRSTPLPADFTDDGFTTSLDQQESIEIFLMQSDSFHPEPHTLLEAWTIRGIPPYPAGQARLSLSFRYLENGLIDINAWDRLAQVPLPTQRLPSGQDLLARLRPRPRDILLAFDASASMKGRPLLEAKLAASCFLQSLSLEDTRLGLLSFGDPGVHLRVPLQQDILLLKAHLAEIKASSTTPLALALDTARSAFQSLRLDGSPHPEKILLLLTDGIPDDPAAAALSASLLRSAGVRILVVGLGSSVDPSYLASSIASSPSDLRSVHDPLDLSSLFLSLASELSGGSGSLAKWKPSLG